MLFEPSKQAPGSGLFWIIAAHEARLLWRTGTVAVLALLMLLWLGLALFTGVTQRARQAEAVARLAARDAETNHKHAADFLADPTGFRARPYVASLLLKERVSLPPGPLAALDVGQSDLRPFTYSLHTDWHKVFFAPGPLRGEASLRAGHFDAGFLVVYILPLAVIALCFNVLSSDRESGAMQLLLSQPVSQATLLGAALLVRAVLLLGAFVLATVLTLTLAGGWSGEAAPRLALWFTVSAAYLLFWFGLAAVVAASGGRPAANAVVLVVLWALLTVAAPGITALAASAQHPTPPRSDIMRAVNVTRDEAFENWRENEKSFRTLYADRPELIPHGARVTPEKILDPLTSDRDFQSRVMIAIAYAVEKVGVDLSEPHRRAMDGRVAFVRAARLFSPAVSAREGLMDAAGTGDDRYRRFDAQAAQFWNNWRGEWMKRIFRGPELGEADYTQRPQFRFQEEASRSVLARSAPGLFSTLLLAAGLFLFAIRRARRSASPLPNA